MKKLLDSDWLRTVQFKCNTSAKSVIQCKKCNTSANYSPKRLVQFQLFEKLTRVN